MVILNVWTLFSAEEKNANGDDDDYDHDNKAYYNKIVYDTVDDRGKIMYTTAGGEQLTLQR